MKLLLLGTVSAESAERILEASLERLRGKPSLPLVYVEHMEDVLPIEDTDVSFEEQCPLEDMFL